MSDAPQWISQVAGFNQTQREALVDLVIWAIHADNVVSFDEHDQLVDDLRNLDWEADTPLDQFHEESGARAKSATGDTAKGDQYFADISNRLADQTSRATALQACRAMVLADGEIDDAEVEFLARAGVAFKL